MATNSLGLSGFILQTSPPTMAGARVFGPEQAKAAVQADKQREQAEKGRKQPRRSLDWGTVKVDLSARLCYTTT